MSKRPLSAAQFNALKYAAHAPGGYGYLVAPLASDGLAGHTGETWRATCCCGSVLMQKIDGRSGRGLLLRNLIRQGRTSEYVGVPYARMVPTDLGLRTLAEESA